MAVTIQTRRDSAVDWATANPVLALGEIGIETDTDKAKYGDGFTAWNDLAYWLDPQNSVVDPSTIDHDLLQNVGTNTHAQVDTHIADTAIHAPLNTDPGTADGNTLRWEADQSKWVESNALVINDSGNVGIGTSDVSAANARLTVNGILDIADGNALAWGGGTGRPAITGDKGSQVLQFLLGSGEKMRIDSSGNLLVGTTASWGPTGNNIYLDSANAGLFLKNNGSANWFRYAMDGSANAQVLNQSAIGVRIVNGTQAWAGVSDEREKNITGYVENALSMLSSWRTVYFHWKDEEKRGDENVGLIAQDVQATLPHAVSTGDDDSLVMRYTDTIPVLVKAIQELTARVEELENG